MYIRVKRTNQTIFLYVEPNETINEVRKKIASILKLPNADQIRLLSAADHHPLQDDKTLQDNKIDNDNIVYWVQKKEGTFFTFKRFYNRKTSILTLRRDGHVGRS